MPENQEDELFMLGQRIRNIWMAFMRDFELTHTGKASSWGNREIPHWDGGETKDGRRCKPVWPKIADFCVKNNLIPDLLVKALFHNKYDHPPRPTMATGADALKQYQNYISSGTQTELRIKFRTRFEAQKVRASSKARSLQDYQRLDKDTAWQFVLLDRAEPLEPLFRYCVAFDAKYDKIVEKYLNAALLQYLQHRELYDEIWGDWLPADLKSKAGTQLLKA